MRFHFEARDCVWFIVVICLALGLTIDWKYRVDLASRFHACEQTGMNLRQRLDALTERQQHDAGVLEAILYGVKQAPLPEEQRAVLTDSIEKELEARGISAVQVD